MKMSKRVGAFIASLILVMCAGIQYSWSIFQQGFMDHFGWPLQSISMVLTVQIFVSAFLPVFIAPIMEKIGLTNYVRIGVISYCLGIFIAGSASSQGLVYLGFGIFGAVGISMIYPVMQTYARQLFPESTGMMTGLVAGFYGAGAIIWAPLASYLKEMMPVTRTLQVFAIIFLALMLPASFFIRDYSNPPAENDILLAGDEVADQVTGLKQYKPAEMLRTSSFYWVYLALTIGALSGMVIIGHASSILQEQLLISGLEAGQIVGLLSLFNAVARVVFGLVSDKIGRFNSLILIFVVLIIAMFGLRTAGGGLFVALLIATNTVYGGMTPLISPLTADLYGDRYHSQNFNYFNTLWAIAGFIGPQMSTFIRIQSGSYLPVFTILLLLSVIALVIVLREKRKYQDRLKVN